MLTLADALDFPLSPAEYLAKKRADLADLCKLRTDAIRSHANADPAYRKALIEDAENAMKNLYDFPGTGGLFDVGDPPAWTECRVDNPEYLWCNNRHYGIQSLSNAYALTGERRYAEKALSDLLDWIAKCPPFPLKYISIPGYIRFAFSDGTVNPWRQFEIGVRMEESWPRFYDAVLMSDVMTPEAFEKIVVSVYQHAEILAAVSPLLWPKANHNHFLVESSGLLFATAYFPEMRHGKEWFEKAQNDITRCLDNQVTPEGAQIEACPSYHNLLVRLIQNAFVAGKEQGFGFPEHALEIYRAACRYTAWMMMPNGTLAPIADTEPHEHGTGGYAAVNYRLFGDFGELLPTLPLVRPIVEEDIPQDVIDKAIAEAKKLPGGARHFAGVGQAVGRTGFTKEDSYFLLSCKTPIQNGHAHCDPMSFVLTLEGEEVVIDPGIFTYADGEARKRFKSAAYHSCLTFGGREPFAYISTWRFGEQKYGRTAGVYEGEGFLAADASHENYEPNQHRRFCLLDGKDTFFVLDEVKNVTHEEVKICFNMKEDGFVPTSDGYSSGKTKVFLPAGTEHSVTQLASSPRDQVEVPTVGLVAMDKSGNDRLYLSVFTRRDDVSAPTAVYEDNGIRLSFIKAGKPVSYLWKSGISVSKYKR